MLELVTLTFVDSGFPGVTVKLLESNVHVKPEGHWVTDRLKAEEPQAELSLFFKVTA